MSTITSLGIGSGLDLNGLLDQLREAERGRLEPLAKQKEAQEAKLSAYGELQGALSAFQSATDALNDSSLFASVSSNVTGSSVTSAASSDAEPGRYDVDVTQLARSQNIATRGFADGHTFSEGTLSIETGSGTFDIAVAEDATLEDIRDSINAAGEGITASIVNDGSDEPFRLVLATNETGTDAEIRSISFDGGEDRLVFGDGATGNSMTEGVAAQDASLEVNGITITSQSNRVEEAIQGVTLDLTETGLSTVNVERDNRGVREAVGAFVDSYNSLRETTGELTSFNAETGEAGELLGDSAMRMVESRLSRTLGDGVAEGEFRALSEIGISLQRDGTLQLDDARLDEVIVNDRDALTEFFAGQGDEPGMAGALSQTLSQMLGDNGLLDSARSGVQTRITSIDNRTERMEISIERTIERYRSQFAQLDSMVAEMNETSSYLTQQFDNLNAMFGRD
ncbi:MAG: flagellar filament capping protein FliD [Halochromatium sp.]|uniref:flagellar filament capping protein FliD n=1 Tax=Halochromatium sp. TaxID=2049430 RepID=UPI00397887E6